MASKQSFSTNTGISAAPEFSSTEYPELYVDALKIRGGIQVLQQALDQYTGVVGISQALWSTAAATQNRLSGLTRQYAVAGVNISQGQTVYFYSVSGVLTAGLANATSTGKPARAYCNGTVSAGAYGEFILEGICPYIGSLTLGATYYQSNTDGLIAPASGTILQRIGFSLGSSTLYFRPDLV